MYLFVARQILVVRRLEQGGPGLSDWENLRGAAGDVWVGVTSIFASGARARVKSFIFYFFHHGHAPYHSRKRKK